MRRIVVHVLLDDGVDGDGVLLGQTLPNRRVGRLHLHFHLVHGRTQCESREKRGRCVAVSGGSDVLTRVRNVFLKC